MVGTKKSSLLGKITVLLVICCFCLPAQAKYGGGKGEPEEPYLIYTAEHMNAIGADSNDWDKHFRLMADIDLSGYTGTSFNIIGADYWHSFTGVFDGNGHTISNFTYTSTGINYIGVFGYVRGDNAEIKNLGLLDPNVDAGTGSVGSLVGELRDGTITNCYAEGGSVSGESYVGGLVGINVGTITNCRYTGSVEGDSFYVGGLVGYNGGKITTSYASGRVSGDWSVGGLVGVSWPGTITNCYSTGSVTGTYEVGGLVGDNYYGRITNCYSTGRVLGSGGGLVGSGGGVLNSFWDTESSGQTTSDGGTGKTTAEMQMASTFVGWGCGSIWTIKEGKDYPRLWWENKHGEPITNPSYGGGSGEPNDPYLIYTAEQLNTIGLVTCHWDKHFKLMADIDLSSYNGTSFNTIGERYYFIEWIENPFTGTFNGNCHTISNFTYTTAKRYTGLFGYVDDPNAEIKNLGLITPNVDVGGGYYVGSLVGWLKDGTISNCYVEGGSIAGGRFFAGGLVGSNDGTITNSHAIVEVSGEYYVGGLVGENNSGTINNCYSTGSFSGYSYIGVLAGGNGSAGTITDCYSTGSVSGRNSGCLVGFNEGVITNCYSTGSGGSGGLVGWNTGTIANCYSTISIYGGGGLVGLNDGTITNCYSTGSVLGHRNVGGLVGQNHGLISNSCATCCVIGYSWAVGGLVGLNEEGTITNCYSTGSVSGEYSVGGLVGDNYRSTITNCYAKGNVSGNDKVGGLAGRNNYAIISNCYSTGNVSGDRYVGGLLGYSNDGTIYNSFWDIETSGTITSAGGTGLATDQMQTMSTFTDAGWDFVGETANGTDDIWFLLKQDYPHLWWQGMQVPMKLIPRTLNCRSYGNWVKAHLILPEGFTVSDVDSNRPAIMHSLGFESAPLYVFVNENERVQIEAAFEREAICSMAGYWPDALTVSGFLADGNIFLGTSKVRRIHPGMKEIEKLAWYWLNEDCVQPDFCDRFDMNRDSLVNLLDYALLMNIEVEFDTDE